MQVLLGAQTLSLSYYGIAVTYGKPIIESYIHISVTVLKAVSVRPLFFIRETLGGLEAAYQGWSPGPACTAPQLVVDVFIKLSQFSHGEGGKLKV